MGEAERNPSGGIDVTRLALAIKITTEVLKSRVYDDDAQIVANIYAVLEQAANC